MLLGTTLRSENRLTGLLALGRIATAMKATATRVESTATPARKLLLTITMTAGQVKSVEAGMWSQHCSNKRTTKSISRLSRLYCGLHSRIRCL